MIISYSLKIGERLCSQAPIQMVLVEGYLLLYFKKHEHLSFNLILQLSLKFSSYTAFHQIVDSMKSPKEAINKNNIYVVLLLLLRLQIATTIFFKFLNLEQLCFFIMQVTLSQC